MRANAALSIIKYVNFLRETGVEPQTAESQAKALVEVMMNLLDEKLVVKEDLIATESNLSAETKSIRAELSAFESSIRADIKVLATREELKAVESSLRAELKAVESSLRAEFKPVESRLELKISELRSELKQDLKDLETRMTVRLGGLMIGCTSITIAIIGCLNHFVH